MKNPLHSTRFGFIAFLTIILAISGCSEESVPTSIGDPELKTGSFSLAVNIVQKEDLLPEMGLLQHLYLGKSAYSEANLILFSFNDMTRGNLPLYSLNDSSSTGRRKTLNGYFRLTVADTLNSSSSFELVKIEKDDGDTLFWEAEPHSQSIDIEGAGYTTEVLDVSQIDNIMYPDSIFRNALEFDLDSVYLSWITDSLSYSNGIYFGVRTIAPESEMLSFNSRLSVIDIQPVIYIDYQRDAGADTLELDTLTAYISVLENLTLVNPDQDLFPSILPGNFSIGNNLGTGVELKFNLGNIDFPEQAIVSDAEISFVFDDASIGQGYAFTTTGVEVFGDENETISGSFQTSINDTTKTISLRDYFQRYVSGNIDTLEGVALRSARTMDPFFHAVITGISDSIRIEYVHPE